MNNIICREKGYYGIINLPVDLFNKLNPIYFISGCTEDIKYMCANMEEEEHLANLGVDMQEVVCDWFCICKEGSKEVLYNG